ncbi:hypothetical protein UFOVP506_10 [uncultured Caudovirales phage]|uniref:Uncharacterized protein n=1 Tax=uncultured Caudovirales phage TaxID=2100421 RepID=A0A6J5MNQ5_9CAUD|nr:hypothetical protein UFOVP506_10 [uncultured Caudovirales phage]
MATVNLTEMQMHDLIKAMDEARTNQRIMAVYADERCREISAQMHYNTAEKYEALILALQAQMKETAA